MLGTLTILPEPPPPPTPVGLIAAGGRLPVLVAEGLRERGHPVHGLGLSGLYERELPMLCDSFRTIGLFRMGTWGPTLRRLGVGHAIMVGKVDKAQLMHDPLKLVRHIPDLRTVRVWYRELRHDRRSYAVLKAIADELDRSGVALIDSTAPIPDQIATTGAMTRRPPTDEQKADIDFVWPLLTETLRLDIGQAIAVRDRDVIAVEAVEGTDRMIERAGALCRAKGWTLCKGARVGHDRRSDVPTVGIDTIKRLYDAGGRCLALAAGDVIMLDKPYMLGLADEMGVSVIGVPIGASKTHARREDA
ncbi:MAG: UDP-2,3-diacylglucosamine diphosphatase LpxI [Planctomycetota bacterium]